MSWDNLVGVVDWYADEELRTRGRIGHVADQGKVTSRIGGPTHIDRVRLLFAARRQPWRLTEVLIEDAGTTLTPQVAAWADDAVAILMGIPARSHVVVQGESWGDFSVRSLLSPSALEAIFAPPWPSRFALPGDLLERDVTAIPDLITRGADQYDVTYNLDLGIITSWSAIIDAETAQRISLVHVTSV